MLKEIRQQPEHVREILMWLSVFVTLALIGFVWMRSLRQDVYALLNPAEGVEELNQAFAKDESASPLANLRQGAGELRAFLFGLFAARDEDKGASQAIEPQSLSNDSPEINRIPSFPLDE